MTKLDVLAGQSFPLGATVRPGKVNFCVFSKNCQALELLLFDSADDPRPAHTIALAAYCQDNETSWFDWDGLEAHAGLLRFVRGLIRFTQSHEVFHEERFWAAPGQAPHITWHGVRLGQPDWGHDSHSLACALHTGAGPGERLHVMLNAYWESLAFELPGLPAGQAWCRIVDTARPAPDDFCEPAGAPPVAGDVYRLEARSAVILLARA